MEEFQRVGNRLGFAGALRIGIEFDDLIHQGFGPMAPTRCAIAAAMGFRDQRRRRIPSPFIAPHPFESSAAAGKLTGDDVRPGSDDPVTGGPLPDAAVDFGSQPLLFLQVSFVRAVDEAERFQMQKRIAKGPAPDHQAPNHLTQLVDDIDGFAAANVLGCAIEIAGDVGRIRAAQQGSQFFMRMTFGDSGLSEALEQPALVVDFQRAHRNARCGDQIGFGEAKPDRHAATSVNAGRVRASLRAAAAAATRSR
ncbi:hypothetical protein [Paracoccus simplex]|uniref:Uncharacterized protein n=1 Tax=Paracoccus simplex TaxID=2086346 RepID=A0ABV7S5F3_9RHOB